MVLFLGNADTPLENHLYSVSYDRPNSEITRLTREGFDHSKIRVSIQAKLFISTYSNVQTPPTCEVYRNGFLHVTWTICVSRPLESS